MYLVLASGMLTVELSIELQLAPFPSLYFLAFSVRANVFDVLSLAKAENE